MIRIINSIIEGLGSALHALLMLLPSSPFNFISLSNNVYIGFINYLFPVAETIVLLESYVSAVAIYYMIRVGLRWIKAVGN